MSRPPLAAVAAVVAAVAAVVVAVQPAALSLPLSISPTMSFSCNGVIRYELDVNDTLGWIAAKVEEVNAEDDDPHAHVQAKLARHEVGSTSLPRSFQLIGKDELA